ncbi:MAG: hypothetical protein A2V66_12320 [Ignavibacteria bacterium RBG_13_36_8]|nr:MAG: hypothetical protein A2V66_12320 [Ignavibacteria bacterium RBG_13_36_8]
MADQCTNLCIRCGKQRVVVKTKKEYINSSLVYTTITACPDASCQKVVDAMLNKEKRVRKEIVENQTKEKELRERRRRRGRIRKRRVTDRIAANKLQQNKLSTKKAIK